MSLLCPSRIRASASSAAFSLAVALTATTAAPVEAAQTYLRPMAEITFEQNTNRNLSTNPDTEADIFGYIANVDFIWGYLTPTTTSTVRPRIRFQYYPDRQDIQRSEQFLDMRTTRRLSERTTWDMRGHLSRRDTFTALGEADFDDLIPGEPDLEEPEPGDDGDVGTELVEDTRVRFRIRPSLNYQFTELTGLGLNASYETTRYDSEARGERQDYDYMIAGAELTRRLDPRNSVSIGPYAARYETRDDVNTTDSLGVSVGWSRDWHERLQTFFSAYWERTEVDLQEVPPVNETDSNFGADINGFYRTETGGIRFNAGRRFQPTSRGSRATVDQVRIGYSWDHTQRLGFSSAVRFQRREGQGPESGISDEDYARAELGVRWMMSRTIFVSGGYEYTWRDREQSADNHTVYISFGYQGLGPWR